MTAFLELLQIYKWSLPSSIVMAAALALVGAQWTAREKSAQVFVLGQGSSLGIVLGLVANILMGTDFHWLSLLFGLTLGWLTLVISDFAIEKKSDRNHIYLTLFVFFLALTYLMTAITPSLESHMAAAYFGDLAVMSDATGQLALVAAALFTGFVLTYWRQLTHISFELVNQSLIHRSWKNRIFDVGTLLLTTLAIQGMGYLFTIGSLFISTSFASNKARNLKRYTVGVFLISTLGCFLGFCLSLLSTNLPTVPCVLIGQIIVGFIVRFGL
ncbi:metal ABC transporter permease [Bdellovibrio sp. NC01]|uniref:metal ABC transporter permease n=1 Tax=Bdellovibrio sp. NC01 TaxID=2220073 RepID=UPI0011592AF8|nr:metal ABC transporter permease [Bdellovibrio sp. NC01]QDK39096.1 zinc ABC transporter ATPase [Bdellovibrio sp. NC01]